MDGNHECEVCGNYPRRIEADWDGRRDWSHEFPTAIYVNDFEIRTVMAAKSGRNGWAIAISGDEPHSCSCGNDVCSILYRGNVEIQY